MKGDSVKSKTGAELKAQRDQRLGQAVAPIKSRRQQLDDYKDVVVTGQRNFVTVGTALGLIARDKLFELDGYDSFESMVRDEFDMSTSTAYRLVDAARVVTILSQVGTVETQIRNQTQALALVPLGKDGAAMVAVVEAAVARGRLTAAVLDEVRGELYPHTKTIEGEVVPEKSPLVSGMRKAIERAAEKTSAGAVTADPTEDASPALGEPDVDVASTSTSGTQTAVAEGGLPSPAADGAEALPAFPADDAPAPAGESVPGSPSGVSQELQDGIEEGIGCDRCDFSLLVSSVDPDASLTEMRYHLRREHDLYGDAAGLALARVRTISPAADTSDTESQVVLQQSGPDFPVGPDHPVATTVLPGIDHHMSAGVSDSGVAPAIAVEPVLEGGGLAPDLPSSSDPEPHPGDRLLHALGVLVHLIDELDPEALGPYLFPGEVELLHLHADRIAEFVGRVGLARSGLVHTP